MHPQPILSFTLFGKELSVYLYGIFIAIGIVAALLVFFFYTSKKKMPQRVQDFVFFNGIVAIALGFLFAQFYQAVYNWIEDGFKNFDFYGAGITAMGGFIGGAAVFLIGYFVVGKFLFKGKEKNLHVKHFNDVFLVAPCSITVAHAFGRLGCLMAGCCHGEFVSSKYTFGTVVRYTYSQTSKITSLSGYYVPVQLYESLFLFALFALLTVLYFKRFNITMSVYLICYAVWRFLIEFFRTDSRGGTVLGLYPSQWQSVVFLVLGVGILVYYYIRKIPFRLPSQNETENKQSKEKTKESE